MKNKIYTVPAQIECEIMFVYNTHEEDKEWIFVRRLDDYEIIIIVKDGCGEYTVMDLTDREKLLLSILDDHLNNKKDMYTKIINILTARIGREK